MRSALVTAAILTCAAAAQTPALLLPAEDLAATARQARAEGVPVLLAFTEAGCPYCARARSEYWLPLQASAGYGRRIVMREVDILKPAALLDFSGRRVTPVELARRYRITTVPTVVIVDYSGRPLAEPVTGLAAEDFYQLYLERAIDAGHAQLTK